jgi:hypothetical protein
LCGFRARRQPDQKILRAVTKTPCQGGGSAGPAPEKCGNQQLLVKGSCAKLGYIRFILAVPPTYVLHAFAFFLLRQAPKVRHVGQRK